jgi:KDO2-lipid IV(A) lauroyltransferase
MRLGARLGDIGYRVAGRQRRRALANLRLAYGDALSVPEREALVGQVFRHFGRGIIDFLRGPMLRPEDVSGMVTCEGWENVATALAAGKGVLMVTAHFGNWEILGRWLATVKHLPLTVVAREPESAAMGEYLRTMREGAGFKVLSKGASARDLLRALRRGEAICLLNDQNSGDVFAPFFGVPAGTVNGPATLALHSGAPLVPIYCVQTPDDTFHVVCLPPVAVAKGTGDGEREGRQDEVARITGALNAVLEGVIRQHPDQWLWLHNRWKSAFAEVNRERAWTSRGWSEADRMAARERWLT